MKASNVTISLAVLLLGACSPAMTPQDGKIAAAPKASCTMETPTGSNMPRRVCKSHEDREAERNESQRTLEQRAYRPNVLSETPASSL